MIEVVIAGTGPDGLMFACELGVAGIRPIVLDPMHRRCGSRHGDADALREFRGLDVIAHSMHTHRSTRRRTEEP